MPILPNRCTHVRARALEPVGLPRAIAVTAWAEAGLSEVALEVAFFVAGVWLLQQQAALPGLLALSALAASGLAAVLSAASVRGCPWIRRTVAACGCAALGYAWAGGCAQLRLADALAPAWEGRDLRLVGVVAGLPQQHERGVRFEFEIERVLTPGARVPRRVVLSWWGGAARADRRPPYAALDAGERWQLAVRLKRPYGAANPHGFDYEAWLFERGVRATGYVRSGPFNERLAPLVRAPGYLIERARSLVRARIEAALAGAPYGGVIAALAIGDQRAIPPEQWQTFTRTGVNHLMSISGLHVTMVSGLVFAVVLGLWRRSPRLLLVLPAQKAAIATGLAAAFGYAALAGFAVPAQRTVYMLAVVAAALWSGASASAPTVISSALLAVVVLDPWAVLAPGFWLSFGAVAAIFYVTAGRIAAPHWLAGWLRVQAAVTLALVPPLLALFQQVSLVSPLANVVAIPLVSLVVAPLALVGAVTPFDLVLRAAHAVMGACMMLLEALSALPEATWEQHAPPAWALAAAVAGVAWLLAPRGLPARWLGTAGLVPLFASAPAPLAAGEIEVVVLDVGQGLSVLVRTARHALLYDTGPAYGSGADSGARIVVPFLRASGVSRLSGLVVSHDDQDHSGGALSVLQALPVDWFLSSLPDLDPLPLLHERGLRCRAGQSWDWDGVRFSVLHPTRASYDMRGLRDNDRSCVVRVAAPGARVLLPGDIERRSEAELLERAGTELEAEVLLAPHQGSRSSSSAEFVAAVRPLVAVFAVGYRNRFGHPHAEVLARYRAASAHLLRTDRDGAVTIRIERTGAARIVAQRAVDRRYWHTRDENDPAPEPQELRLARSAPDRGGVEAAGALGADWERDRGAGDLARRSSW